MLQVIRSKTGVLFGALLALLMLTFFMISLQKVSPAMAATITQCKIALAIDRSASVGTALGDANVPQLKQFVRNLFQPGGIYDQNKFLAFWSFSSQAGGTQSGSNYDSPWSHLYVSTKGTTDPNYSTFDSNLNQIQAWGGTSYEEGFGFKGYHYYNTPHDLEQVLNTSEGINQTIQQANVIIFITDGVPATPGVGDNNQEAQDAGKSAVDKLRSAGKVIMAGLIQGQGGKLSTLNYVINGNATKGTDANGISDTSVIDASYTDFTAKVRDAANAGCDEAGQQPQPNTYTITPVVDANPRVASGNTPVTLSYTINNKSDNGASSDPTDWNVYQMFIPPGVSANPLYFGGAPYKDDWSCQDAIASLNTTKTVSCNSIANGHGTQFPAITGYSLDAMADQLAAPNSATKLTIDGSFPIGEKICYMLAISKPTDGLTPVNRFSQAACTAVGTNPTVNVIGGDLRAGGNFSTDAASSTAPDSSKIQGIVSTKQVNGTNMVYGSWTEYAAIAPGDIANFASASGFQGGYDPTQQDVRFKLTLANTVNPRGHFTDNNSGMRTIPDYAKTIRESQNPVSSFSEPLTLTSGSNQSGLYEKDNGDLIINKSTLGKNGTTHKGESVVVYVPNGKVTITDDIHYDNGPYMSTDEVPQLVIIAKSIIIQANVTNVDAWLVANDATDGWVYTCDVLPPAHLSTNICNKPLRINGPIISRHLSLRRTAGSGTGGSQPSDPAELINLPGTSYLWAQSAGRSEVRAETTFTTELPPYF